MSWFKKDTGSKKKESGMEIQTVYTHGGNKVTVYVNGEVSVQYADHSTKWFRNLDEYYRS